MGTWAEGNFANDGALDYLGDIINILVSTIEKHLNTGTFADLDECGESELMPSVEIIYILCSNCNGAPPKADKIKEWQEKYLNIFDSQIEALGADEDYKTKRREVINSTFKKLLEYSQEFWNY